MLVFALSVQPHLGFAVNIAVFLGVSYRGYFEPVLQQEQETPVSTLGGASEQFLTETIQASPNHSISAFAC